MASKTEIKRLAKEIVEGNESAKAAFYEVTRSRLDSYIRSHLKHRQGSNCPESTSDIAQTTYRRFFEKMLATDPEKNIAIQDAQFYLFGIARNFVLNSARDRQQMTPNPELVHRDDPDVERVVGSEPSPSAASVRAETIALIQGAFDALTPDDRALFLLRYPETCDATWDELATALGIPSRTLQDWYKDLRQKMQDFLNEKGIQHE